MNIIPSYCSDITCNLKLGYVYLWTCKINNKKYIGSHDGKRKDYIGSGVAFLRAVKKYGIENFYRIILYVGPNFRKVEDEILKAIDCEHSRNFYNSTNETTSPMLGKHHTDEAKQKISIAVSGENNPMFGVPSPMTGKNHTDETKKKMSEAQRGEKGSAYGKPAHNRGIPMTEEAKIKMIITKKKNLNPANHLRWHEKRNIVNPKCQWCLVS